MNIRRALISVSDKTDLTSFAKQLADRGIEIISTGGTARTLSEAAIPVVDVSTVTGFPEIMDGRVKTLHPKVHGGLLGVMDNEEHVAAMEEHAIESIDLLVSNLYPFEKTVATPGASVEEIIEQIDIGGPAMVRAGAKNWRHTVVVVDPSDYQLIIDTIDGNQGKINDSLRLSMASKAFARIAEYDRAISDFFCLQTGEKDDRSHSSTDSTPLVSGSTRSLRYGENPHQKATLRGDFDDVFTQIHGKELSYNNILDISAATGLSREFDEPTVVIVKHTNPCGVGSGASLIDAWVKAFATDRTSTFGGIVAVNRPISADLAAELNDIFLEVLIAPSYEEEAMTLLRKKKDRRLITYIPESVDRAIEVEQLRSVIGGVLVQDADNARVGRDRMTVATERQPTEEEWAGLLYAWRVAKHVKSNAIVYALGDRTLGVGAGQMSRLDSALIAARKAERAALDLTGCAVASDAFFPFADGLLEAVAAGATSAIQPGGSVRDQEVIDAANEKGIAMVLTGTRHFRH